MVSRNCVAAIVLALSIGCAGKSTGVAPSATRTALLTGTVAYEGSLALPQDAVLEVWVADASPAALAPILAETAFLTDGRQVPIAFQLWYDPQRLDASRQYTAHAVIRQDGQILYRTASETPALTQGNPTHVDLVLTPPPDATVR